MGNYEGWTDCKIADFMEKIEEEIVNVSPDVFIVGFQEDAMPGSYFHSHLLLDTKKGDGLMTKLGYKLLGRSKMIGVGITTWKAAKNLDVKARGLRTSIYVKNDSTIKLGGTSEYMCSSSLTRGKRASAIYLNFPHFSLAVINSHLPFDAKSLLKSREANDPIIRQNALFHSNICFNNIVRELIHDHKDNIDFVIFMGDLNYRINSNINAAILADKFLSDYDNPDKGIIKEYIKHDELRQQMAKENIYTFLEGVNDEGPVFEPTCKMVKGRDESCNLKSSAVPAEGSDCWNTGKHGQRLPSWCDRILYLNKSKNNTILCSDYNRFDYGETMLESDHAGVMSIFDIY